MSSATWPPKSVRVVPLCTPEAHGRGYTHSVCVFDGNGRWTGCGFARSHAEALAEARAHRKHLRKLGYRVTK